jgi:hypothetical protein
MLMELPQSAMPNTLKLDPNLPRDRRLTVEPRNCASSTERLLPKRLVPYIDMLDPKRVSERMLADEPM